LLSAIHRGVQLRRSGPGATTQQTPMSMLAMGRLLNNPTSAPSGRSMTQTRTPPNADAIAAVLRSEAAERERRLYQPPVPRDQRINMRGIAAAAAAAARGVPEAPPMNVEEKRFYGLDGVPTMTKQQHAAEVTKAVAAAVGPKETIIRGLRAELGSLADELTVVRSQSRLTLLEQELAAEQKRNGQLIDLLLYVASNGSDGNAVTMEASLGSALAATSVAVSSSSIAANLSRDAIVAHADNMRSQWVVQREQTIKKLSEAADNTKGKHSFIAFV
jgi:hypothetical protein